MENITTIVEQAPQWLQAIGGILVASKAITVLTPTKVDDRWLAGLGTVYNILMKVLNVTSLNVGFDKNKDAK